MKLTEAWPGAAHPGVANFFSPHSLYRTCRAVYVSRWQAMETTIISARMCLRSPSLVFPGFGASRSHG
jgi:hypothetical protein